MSGWGNQDAKAVYGTSVNVTNGSTLVVGTGTQFTANLVVGDVIGIHSDLYAKYRVTAIANNTYLTLSNAFVGTSNTTLPISYVTINQQPKYASINGGTNGQSSFDAMQSIYGVDVNEIKAGLANVTSIAVNYSGTKYKEVPSITVSGGGASSNASANVFINTSGGVANVSIYSTGAGYTSTPTVTIGSPFITFASAAVTTSANTITYTGHLFATGDAAVYNNGGGTSVVGLTSGSTYYVIKIGANAIALASSSANALANTQIALTGVGVGSAHTLTLGTTEAATAVASLGIGSSVESKGAHIGWVKKTVGTGGRAGRIQYETLVATATIVGDAVDDKTFPDA